MEVQIVLKSLERLYPALVYKVEDKDKEIEGIDNIYNEIDSNGEIFVLSNRFSKYGEIEEPFANILKKEDILSIINVDEEEINLDKILTLSEAAKKWGLADGSTIRKAIERGKFNSSEIKQAGAVWVTTYRAMARVFGDARNQKNKIDEKELDEVLALMFFLDARKAAVLRYKSTAILDKDMELLEKMMDSESLRKYSNLRVRLDKILQEAYNSLKNGERIIFYKKSKSKEKITKIINTVDEFRDFINKLDEKNKINPITKREIMEKIFE